MEILGEYMLLGDLEKKGLIHPPSFLVSNTCYLTIMGSHSYGTADTNAEEKSDWDIYGITLATKEILFPHLAGEIYGFGRQKKRFEQFLATHVCDQDAAAGKGREYDITVFNIIKFFMLAMECNPNILDSIFTPQECVLHCTQVGNMIRENRKIFLSKAVFPKMKGYSYSQLHKMTTKEPSGKRKVIREKYGFDCYDDEETEFLTKRGWFRYDDVKDDDELATVTKVGDLEFQKCLARISKLYSGVMYEVDSFLSRFFVTENHNVFVSPAHRNPATKYSSKYFPEKADWQLITLKDIIDGNLHLKRCFYHTMRGIKPNLEEYPVEDEYLYASGLFLSEGSIQFRNKKVKNVAISQTEKGKLEEVQDLINKISKQITVKKYLSHRKEGKLEIIYHFGRQIAERLYKDFGHGSKVKKLPIWCFNLSYRQSLILWSSIFAGDGSNTTKNTGQVIYTSSKELADSIQAMLFLSGHICSVRGPYLYEDTYTGNTTMWQIYRPKDQRLYRLVGFRNIKPYNEPLNKKESKNIKKRDVENRRVVCFEVENGTLVTRSRGKIAIQGNCKFGMNVVRLLLECEQILVEGDLDLQRHKEQLKAIRRGEISEEEIRKWASDKEKQLEEIYAKSTLPWGPDEDKIKQLLIDCLEAHYGNLEKAIINPDKNTQILRQMKELMEKVEL